MNVVPFRTPRPYPHRSELGTVVKDYELAKKLLQELELVSLCNVTYAIKSADHYRLLRKTRYCH